MRRLYAALFILGALTVPFSAHGQTTDSLRYANLTAVQKPEEALSACVPQVGEAVYIVSEILIQEDAEVTALWKDLDHDTYVIQINGDLQFVRYMKACTLSPESLLWYRLVDEFATKQTAGIFPIQIPTIAPRKVVS